MQIAHWIVLDGKGVVYSRTAVGMLLYVSSAVVVVLYVGLEYLV